MTYVAIGLYLVAMAYIGWLLWSEIRRYKKGIDNEKV